MNIELFTWEDLESYAALVDDGRGSYGVVEANEYLRQPNLNPERDCFVARENGTMLGFVLVIPELVVGRAILEGSVLAEKSEHTIGLSLLKRALKHSFDLGAQLVHVSANEQQMGRRELYRMAGFVEVKRQWQMRLMVKDLNLAPMPANVFVRTMIEGEEMILTNLQNQAFNNSWGFASNTSDEVAYRMRMNGGCVEDGLILSREDMDVAYCWTKMLSQEGQQLGVIWMIGALPEARGKGWGRVMLTESMRSLMARGAEVVELTVYSDNVPAVNLYQSVGFKKKFEIIWFEKGI